ncbi:GAF domain-containing protein [soil metagenome]
MLSPGHAALPEAKRTLARSTRTSSLCDPFLSVVPVTGAAISVLVPASAQTTVCSSDDTAAQLDELQFDLGEGPCWQSLALRSPVLSADLRNDPHGEWPMFAAAVRNAPVADDVGAMYAFPLFIGSLDIGAVDLYSHDARELTPVEIEDGRDLAKVVTWQVIRRMLGEYDDTGLGGEPHSRREVHQATGMVLAQLDISAADAAVLLKAHAFSTGRSVNDIAADVIERRLTFLTE